MIRSRRVCVVACAAATAVASAAAPVHAQRRPAVPPGQVKKIQQTQGTIAAAGSDTIADLAGAGVRVRSLGAWLDDARVLPPGEGWLALSFNRWHTPLATGTDAPGVDVSIGLGARVHAAISAPYFRATDATGTAFRGMGDLYLGAKVQLRDPDSHRVGVAIGPTLEIVSAASAADGSNRVNWLLPLNLEWQRGATRLYGSTGYFSRRVLFASGAVERAVSDRLVLTGALSQAYAIDHSALDEELGLGRRRVDVSGGVSYFVSPTLSLFGSLGRTISHLDADGTRLLASAGVSVNVIRPRSIP